MLDYTKIVEINRTGLISGIYKIRNIKNDKCYIGSAVNFKRRVSGHLSALRKNKHHSPRLQKSFNKNGEHSFEFILLITCPVEYLLKLEQKFLDEIKPYYNMSPTAANCLGKKDSIETRPKKSLNNPHKGKFGSDNNSSKTIYQYSIDGKFIKKWYGSNEVSRANIGFDPGNIRTAVRKKTSAYGFMWLRDYMGLKIDTSKKRRKVLKNLQVIQKTLSGDFVKLFKNIREAGDELKKCPSSIRRCVQGRQKTAYGFLWEKVQ